MFVSAILLVAAGCGLPAPPQPPSLNLPAVVEDLSAARTGDAVALHWTVPTQNTDKTPVRKALTSHICRKDQEAGECRPVGSLAVGAGQGAEFHDTLPPELQAGAPRPVLYRVALDNSRGRSAGESNVAAALAGAVPPSITNLVAENTPRGIKLSWQTAAQVSSQPGENEKVIDHITRTTLHTEVVTPPKNKATPSEHTLEVPASTANAALDSTRDWGDTYRYQVQAVAQVPVEIDGKFRTLEMAGMASLPAEVQARQVFPPAAPQALAVVPVWGSGGKSGVDLSWEPNTEPTLAGYQVYRITRFARRALARRQIVSGDKLLTAPAFSDRDLTPGNGYVYSVVAVDSKGNVSPESNQVEVTARAKPD